MAKPGPKKTNDDGVEFKLRAVRLSDQPGVLVNDALFHAWASMFLAVFLAILLFAARKVLSDSCLDSGGRWSRTFLECVR